MMEKIYNESGKGYWMEGFGCLRSEGENRPSRPGHVILGCDLYNFQVTGSTACNLNASSCNSPTHSGPSALICLNDQGGDIMNVSEESTATLRAQDHGHPPVVCFEPGILRRDCSAGNRAYIDICSTLRAQMGDNQPAVCYSVNSKQYGMTLAENQCNTLAANDFKEPQIVCYAIDHVITTGGNCTAQGPCVYKDICPTEKAAGVHAVCYEVRNE